MKALLEKQSSDPKQLADQLNLWQINDEDYLTNVCKHVMEQNPTHVRKKIVVFE